jgi:aldose 1-epimerase
VTLRRERLGPAPDGRTVERVRLRSASGAEAELLSYGATLARLRVPDRSGRAGDVVLGFDDWERYLGPHPHLGATVGRYANRIANARFPLEGREVRLTANEGRHHLHGGSRGLGRTVFAVEPLADPGGGRVRFACTSPDGDEGYPGRLAVSVTFTLGPGDELALDLEATTDRPTVVNLSHHPYFHLGDGGRSPALDHELWLAASRYTPVDREGIPTGAIEPVPGTALDFSRPRRLGARLHAVPGGRGGYDHNFVLDPPALPGTPRLVARVRHPGSGRTLEVLSTWPGLQLYTGNLLAGLCGRDGARYERFHGFCLEPQHFPDSPNRPQFPSTLLRPGERYAQRLVLRFSC